MITQETPPDLLVRGQATTSDVLPRFREGREVFVRQGLVIHGSVPQCHEDRVWLGFLEIFHKTQSHIYLLLRKVVDKSAEAFSIGHGFI
ncbi:MAG: hypothetical protein ACJ76Y_19235 [Thermoanaerobaculia bacterium]